MAKQPGRKQQRNKSLHATDYAPEAVVPYHPKPARIPIEARTETQKRYANALKSFELVFAIGPAGTGKTWLPTAIAADALADKKIEKLVITRPAVEAGESLGFLPGELDEKYEPYLAPVRQVLTERLGKGALEYNLKAGKIEPIPLGFMRGLTLSNCVVIVDEAQNITPKQMKMLLTRIGENCRMVICGDTDQVDITGPSGLADAIKRVGHIPTVKVIKFSRADVVRSGLVKEILGCYADPGAE